MNAPYVFTFAVGRPDIAARSNFYALFVVLPATVLLIQFFGLSGAGYSSVFYHLFAYAYMARRTCIECLHLSPWQWYLHVMKFMGLASFIYGAPWMVGASCGVASIPGLVLSYAMATALFLALAYPLVGNELRISFKQISFKQPAFPGKRA